MSAVLRDLRFTFRVFLKQPAYTLMILGILALGIAGNTAIFSIFNGLFLRPFPVENPERLVDLNERAPKWNLEYTGIAPQDFHAWREQNQTFEGMAVWQIAGCNLTIEGRTERIQVRRATYDYATVLGIQPILGRMFTEEEDRLDPAKVALLGYGLWQRLFGGETDVLGKTLQLNSELYTVIGVLPSNASFPDNDDCWVPVGFNPNEGSGWWMSGIGRLREGITLGQARNDLNRIHKSIIETRPVNEITSPRVEHLRDRYLGEYKRVCSLLLGGVGFVLLIACANIAGLMLARGSTRNREMGIRIAFGATRGRIVQQILTESLMLSSIGVLFGLLLGKWVLNAVLSLNPTELPLWVNFQYDLRCWFFCLFAMVSTTLLFGISPALQAASNRDIRGALMASTVRASGTRGSRRILNTLIVGEFAMSLILLIGAGLLIQAFREVQKVDPGFRAENVLSYRISLPGVKYEETERYAFFQNHLEQVRALPGVQSVGAASTVPLGGHTGSFFEVEGAPPLGPDEQNPVVLRRFVMPGYFEAMGVKLIAGRFLAESDVQAEALVVLVNETFAKRYWPDSDPIGKRIRRPSEDAPWINVIGVTKDVKHYGLDQAMRPGVYIPNAQNPLSALSVVVRSSVDPLGLVNAVRGIVRSRDPDLPIYGVSSMTQRLNESLWVRRLYSGLFVVFAVIAVLLAAGGLYGVISYSVNQRTREIGIRMALGAQQGNVLYQVMKQGSILIVIGLAIGLVGALALARLLAGLLHGVSAADPTTFAFVSLLLMGVALMACFFPARKAAKVDPMVALRYE